MKKHIIVVGILILLAIIGRLLGADFTEVLFVEFLLLLYGFIIARDIIKNTKSKVLKALARIYRILGAIFITIFIIIEGIIWSNIINPSNAQIVGKAPYVVVLGSGLTGDKPGAILEGRLNVAIEYLNTYKDAKVICSGGQGVGEIIPESFAMKSYLLSKGIASDRIILEDKSKTTIENLVNTKKILTGLKQEHSKIVIATSSFNILRVKIIAHELDLNAKYIGSTTKFRFNLNYSIREFGAILDNYFEIKTGIYL